MQHNYETNASIHNDTTTLNHENMLNLSYFWKILRMFCSTQTSYNTPELAVALAKLLTLATVCSHTVVICHSVTFLRSILRFQKAVCFQDATCGKWDTDWLQVLSKHINLKHSPPISLYGRQKAGKLALASWLATLVNIAIATVVRLSSILMV